MLGILFSAFKKKTYLNLTLFLSLVGSLFFFSSCVTSKYSSSSRRPAGFSDVNTPTVCTLTINSDNEARVFRSNLTDFHFTELFQNFEPASGQRSVSRSTTLRCDPHLSCDIVLISGNFAGRFQGAYGDLKLEELEKRSCQSECSGIFDHPKEVFLMGCNTLATKDPDRRTIEDYLKALAKDHVPLRQAQRVAAYRYSELGLGFGDRLRQIFKNPETHIYGFDSIAPSGNSVEPLLRDYFSRVGNYRNHLAHLSEKADNLVLSQALRSTSFVERRGGGDPGAACLMSSPSRTDEKINFINQVLWGKDDSLKYLPLVLSYQATLANRSNGEMSESEASYWERLQSRNDVKKRIFEFYEKLSRSLPLVRLDLLQFSYEMGWLSNTQFRTFLARDFNYEFKNNVDGEIATQFCDDHVRINLRFSELDSLPWSPALLQMIGCSGTSDSEVRRILNQLIVTSEDPRRVVFALGQLWPQDLQSHFYQLIQSSSLLHLESAILVMRSVNLKKIGSGPIEVFTLLAKHVDLLFSIDRMSQGVSWEYSESQILLDAILSSPLPRVRRVALDVLQRAPSWVKRREVLDRLSSDPDPLIREIANHMK